MATSAIGSVASGVLGGMGGGSGSGIFNSGFMSALGGSLGSELPSFLGNVFGSIGSKKEAKKARKWAEQMRATAYQTAVQDMIKAGLNPVLAVSGFSPASAPSTPLPNINYDVGDLSDSIGRFLGAAKQSQAMKDQLATIQAQRRAAEADADVAERTRDSRVQNMYQEAYKTGAESVLLEDQALRARAERKLVGVRTELEASDLPAARAKAEIDASEFGTRLRQLRRAMEVVPAIGVTRGRPRVGGGQMTIRSR